MDTRTVTAFDVGVYLVYDVRGTVRITLSKTAGANALLNGLFVGGPVPPPVSDKPLQLALRDAGGNALMITITGDSGQRFRLESSTDLQTWNPVTTGTLVSSSTEVQVPRDQPRLYLRTVNLR
jgi:hypothetical protein